MATALPDQGTPTNADSSRTNTDAASSTAHAISVTAQTPLLWSPLQPGVLFDTKADPIVTTDRQSRASTSTHLPTLPLTIAAFDDLNDQEVQQLLALTFNALKARRIPLPRPLSSTVAKPVIYDNAHFEQIACTGLVQKYVGSPNNLIPTLNLIHIRRQDEVWEPTAHIIYERKTVVLTAVHEGTIVCCPATSRSSVGLSRLEHTMSCLGYAAIQFQVVWAVFDQFIDSSICFTTVQQH